MRRRKGKKKNGKAIWYKHKGIRRNAKGFHQHPSHPYPHPKGRWHRFPPTSRIRDRKGKAFRGGPERIRTRAKGTYKTRAGQRKRWD